MGKVGASGGRVSVRSSYRNYPCVRWFWGGPKGVDLALNWTFRGSGVIQWWRISINLGWGDYPKAKAVIGKEVVVAHVNSERGCFVDWTMFMLRVQTWFQGGLVFVLFYLEWPCLMLMFCVIMLNRRIWVWGLLFFFPSYLRCDFSPVSSCLLKLFYILFSKHLLNARFFLVSEFGV